MSNEKASLDQHGVLSASMELVSLDAWINQHLFEKEERMRSSTPNGASPFNWHQASINDLKPSTSLIEVVDLDKPIKYE